MWAHESRANLEPLRFSTHECSGVGSESGYERTILSIFLSRGISATRLFVLPCDSFSRNGSDGRPFRVRDP